MISQVYTYDKTYPTVHLKHVQFIVLQLYLNKAILKLSQDTLGNSFYKL